jgi:O-antigen/teichoic acid export membrane protein
MGLIIRQGFKSGMVTYIAVIVGLLNNTFIYPAFLEIKEFGEIQFVLQTAIMLVPFLIMGFSSVSAKFYPDYSETPKSRSSFFTFLLTAPFIGSILLIGLVFAFRHQIVSFYQSKDAVDEQTVIATCIIAVLMVFNTTMSSYAANLKRIAIPTVLNNLIKFTLPVLCVVYFYSDFSISFLFIGAIAHYAILFIAFAIYLYRLDGISIDLSLIKSMPKARLSQMASFAVFGILAGIGTTLATKIDTFMIVSFSEGGVYDNGLYSFALFASNTVAMPIVIISGLATPLIAGYWKSNSREEIDKIYKQSSLNMLVIGGAIFLAIATGIDYLFEFMPKGDEFRLAKVAVIILSFTRLMDLAAGLNSQILSMSERYKMFFYFLVFLSITNIILNLTLIPQFGIQGAATATLISIGLFNLLKFIYLKQKYQLQPFDRRTVWVLLILLVSVCLGQLLPALPNPWMSAIVWPSLITFLFLLAIYWLRLSDEINNFINDKLSQVNSIFKRD